MLTREQIATRVARELPDGASVYFDPAWAALLRAALPQGVTVREQPEGEVDVAVISAASVDNQGAYAGESGRAAHHVIAIVAPQQGEDGTSRVVKAGEPLPGRAQTVITDFALFDVTPQGLVMREVAQGVSALDVQLKSDAPLLASDELKVMSV